MTKLKSKRLGKSFTMICLVICLLTVTVLASGSVQTDTPLMRQQSKTRSAVRPVNPDPLSYSSKTPTVSLRIDRAAMRLRSSWRKVNGAKNQAAQTPPQVKNPGRSMGDAK